MYLLISRVDTVWMVIGQCISITTNRAHNVHPMTTGIIQFC